MRIIMKANTNSLQAEYVAGICKKNGHPAFVGADRRVIVVPSFPDANPDFLTRWAFATIERIEPTSASLDLACEGLLEFEEVFV